MVSVRVNIVFWVLSNNMKKGQKAKKPRCDRTKEISEKKTTRQDLQPVVTDPGMEQRNCTCSATSLLYLTFRDQDGSVVSTFPPTHSRAAPNPVSMSEKMARRQKNEGRTDRHMWFCSWRLYSTKPLCLLLFFVCFFAAGKLLLELSSCLTMDFKLHNNKAVLVPPHPLQLTFCSLPLWPVRLGQTTKADEAEAEQEAHWVSWRYRYMSWYDYLGKK